MSQQNSLCTDEELLEELKKLGYDDISPEVFDIMKEGLVELIEKKKTDSSSNCSSDKEHAYLSASQDSREDFNQCRTSEKSNESQEVSIKRKTKSKPKSVKSYSLQDKNIHKSLSSEDSDYYNTGVRKTNFNSSFEDIVNEHSDEVFQSRRSPDKVRNVNKIKSNNAIRKLKNLKDDNSNEDAKKYIDNAATNSSFEESDFQSDYLNKNRTSVSHASRSKYRNDFSHEDKLSSSFVKTRGSYGDTFYEKDFDTYRKNVNDRTISHKTNDYLKPHGNIHHNSSVSESLVSEKKTIKRKVLRRRNGRSIVTEEMVEVPSIFETSYLDSDSLNNSKSFSSDDLSCKSNSSTGSVNIISPESSIKSSPSTFSLLTTRSTPLRLPNRKKKSDPVAMYNYYKKFWDNFKPPGENTHDRLRWAVRDKMLDYDL